MKILFTLITFFSIQIAFTQLWVKNGDDFIVDTTGALLAGSPAFSIDSSGNRVAVSYSRITMTEQEYRVQVFDRVNGTLVQVGQTLMQDSSDNSNSFGSSIDINSLGNVIAIGLDSYDHNQLNLSGQVRIYELIGNTWTQKGSYIGGNSVADYVGSSIDLDRTGNTIVVGADENNIFNQGGFVVTYDWNGMDWVVKGDTIQSTEQYDKLGSVVNISEDGNTILTCAPGFNDTVNNFSDAGVVRAYNWNGSNWIQMGNDFTGTDTQDQLGSAIKLSGDGLSLVLGNGAFNNDTGRVEVYKWDVIMSDWIQKGNTLYGQFQADFGDGASMSADGNTLVITGDYDNWFYTWNSTTSTWDSKYTTEDDPYVSIGYGQLNHTGTLFAGTGTIVYLNPTSIGGIGRFYTFDENAMDLDQLNEENDFVLYPNPTSDFVTISLVNDMKGHYTITNSTGQILENIAFNGNKSIDIRQYPKGIYFITVIQGNSRFTRRLSII